MFHLMRLHQEPYEKILNKTKNIEMRLYDEKRRLIQKDDIIIFENSRSHQLLKTIVKNLHKFNNFEELYNNFDKVRIGYKKDEIAKPSDMELYYPKEKIREYGVIGIEIEVLDEIINIKDEIKVKLLLLEDLKYKEFHSKLCPNVNNIIGVRLPKLRNLAKELLEKYSLEILLANIDNKYYEEIMLEAILIGYCKDINIVTKLINNFVNKIDNWAVCDTFCAGLKITKKNKDEMFNLIVENINSNQEFKIRFGVVMLLDYYIEKEYINQLFNIFDNITNHSYYVEMAVAWAISFCLIKFYDETAHYLKTCKLSKFTYNKALQKAIESYRISEHQKEELRKLKK